MHLTFCLRTLAIQVMCASFLVTTTASAKAIATNPSDVYVTNNPTKLAEIGIGIAVIGAGIGIGIYYGLHHNRSLTGCSVAGSNGPSLLNEGDRQTYALIGAVGGIRAGERVRVSGKKQKKDAAAERQFLVEKLSKDLGPCKVLPVTP